MKDRLFSKKGEVILSALTLLIISGLLYQGFFSLKDPKNSIKSKTRNN